MRSGIGDYLDEEAQSDISDYVMRLPVNHFDSAEAYLAVLDGFPQVSPPGAEFVYNNGAFELLDGALLLYRLVPNLNVVSRAMSAFQSGDRAITASGLAPTSDAGGASVILAPTILSIGGYTSGAVSTLGYIRKVRYLPRRPSNAEMQTMTT